MKEEVIVTGKNCHYLPNFTNPIYVLKKQQDELKKELLWRIKTGCFSKLYPLLSHLSLPQDQREEILLNWFLEGNINLCDAYGEALKANDLETIKKIDSFYKKEVMRRQ